jgi:hypothetical protein
VRAELALCSRCFGEKPVGTSLSLFSILARKEFFMNKNLPEIKLPVKAIQERPGIADVFWYVFDADGVKHAIGNEKSVKTIVDALNNYAELLGVLDELMEWFDMGRSVASSWEEVRKLRIIIAKAKGEQS